MNMGITLTYFRVGSEDVNKMTKYIKQTVTKTHLNLEFDSSCSLCNLLGLYWDVFHDCDRDKRTIRHKLQKKKKLLVRKKYVNLRNPLMKCSMNCCCSRKKGNICNFCFNS